MMRFVLCMICIPQNVHSLRVFPSVKREASRETRSDPEFHSADASDVHLQASKSNSRFIQHKTMRSTFKLGRAGSNSCLSFLHIPKNAGTTIENIMLSAKDKSLRYWGRFDTDLQCDGPTKDGRTMRGVRDPATWEKNETEVLSKYRYCSFAFTHNEVTRNMSCPAWHIPPHLDKRLAASYTSDGCETFCVVRSPSEKFFSEMRYEGFGKNPMKKPYGVCSMSSFHDMANDRITKVKQSPYEPDCHFVPQTEFIYGTSSTPQFCKHQLRFENLEEDFEKLMLQYNIPVGVSQTAYKEGNSGDNQCHIPFREDSTSQDWIKTYYSQDLKNFNYVD